MQEGHIKRKPTGRHPGLRSLNNRLFNCPVKVRFVNATKRDVDILWASYDHDYILYHTLKPLHTYSITTYVGHPWIFEDSLTRDPMVVHESEVWWPPPREQIKVFITLPVLSLKTLASRTVRDCLKSTEDASRLELPATLRRNLEMLANALHFHRNRETLNWADEPASREPTDLERERIVLVALKLHEVLSEINDRNVTHLILMSVQLFLQYIQRKVNPHHAAIQALLMIFQSFMDGDDTWIEVDQLLLSHVEEMVGKMLKMVDVHYTLNQVRSVLNFIEHIAVNIISKYSAANDTPEEV